VTALSPLERLDAFLVAVGSPAPAIQATPAAAGWATVELDRAVAELAVSIGIPAERFAAADDDELLGARCRVAHRVLAEGRSLVVLEPATEGRLAATLARHDEGPAAIWLATAVAQATAVPLAALTLTSARRGPLGTERLLLGGPVHGPHRLLLGPAGTIRP
jgi:hypothetical protein